MTPHLGQGACQAFEDAVALGTVLEGTGTADVPAALRTYAARRQPRTAALQHEARRMNRMLGLTGLQGRLRDALLERHFCVIELDGSATRPAGATSGPGRTSGTVDP